MQETYTESAPTYEGAPLSQGIRHGNTLYLSGQIGMDPATGELVEGGAGTETSQIMENVSAVLEAAGSSLDQIVKTTVFLTNLDDYDDVNESYQEYLSSPFPARSAVEVSDLVLDAAVEIEVVASV